ncbi:hypothetical protein CPC16_007560, partial [Podila verticillata]
MADTSNLSPCKVSFNGAFRRFLIARPATWTDFETKLRGVYNLSPSARLDVQYKDEEGDVITLSTDSELEDVLSMHALFSQIAPVNTWSLGQHGSTQRERSATVTSLHSDDGSLIEFEEAAETILEHSTPYPQPDTETATLRDEQEIAEAHKLDTPFFPSFILGAPQVTSENEKQEVADMETESTQTNESVVTALLIDTAAAPATPLSNTSRRSSKPGSPVVPVIEFEALRMENAPEVMDSILASAMEQHAEEVEAARAQSGDEDPAEPEVAAAPTHTPDDSDRALIEQFQMLIQEFQHVIQNNPQMVALAGSIMNKILSHVKVNVESFASYLQETASQAAANATASADEASQSCPFSSGEDRPFGRRGHGGRRGGFFGHGGSPRPPRIPPRSATSEATMVEEVITVLEVTVTAEAVEAVEAVE